MTTSRWLPALGAGVALLFGTAAARADDAPATTQESPLATEPLPVQGPGQAATGAAVTGSAPPPGTESPVDASQAQTGVLLKPGEAADDMGAAAGAAPSPGEQPTKP